MKISPNPGSVFSSLTVVVLMTRLQISSARIITQNLSGFGAIFLKSISATYEWNQYPGAHRKGRKCRPNWDGSPVQGNGAKNGLHY